MHRTGKNFLKKKDPIEHCANLIKKLEEEN